MIVFEEFRVKTPEREVLLEITNEIKQIVKIAPRATVNIIKDFDVVKKVKPKK